MRAGVAIGAVRRFSTAVIDQIMLSAANFLVGLMLLRYTSSFDYGIYVLIQSALLLLVSAQSSGVSSPLVAVAPKRSPTEGQALVGAVMTGQRRLLRWAAPVALVLVLAGFVAGRYSALMAEVLCCGVVAGWGALRRDFMRCVLLMYSKPGELLRADVLYVGVLLAGVLLAALHTATPIVWVTVTLAAAAWTGTAGAYRSVARDPGWVSGDEAGAWRDLRVFGLWSLFGSVSYWLFGQSYSYLLATRLDLKAVAAVNEARLLLMPAFVLSIGMQSLLVPSAAKWNALHGYRALIRRLLLILGVIGALDLAYFLFVWVFRGWLIDDVFRKHIADRDRLLLLWAIIAIVALMRDVMLCGLTAIAKFKWTASQTAFSAVVALTVMWFGMSWWGAPGVLIGQLAGEVVIVTCIVTSVWRYARSLAQA